MPETNHIQHITLHIYDEDIPINVKADQEEYYRSAADLINERLNAYFNAYKGKQSDKMIMYYAMIDIAIRCVKGDTSAYDEILGKLTEEIESVLAKS